MFVSIVSILPAICIANNSSVLVCSQLVNKSGVPLDYLVDGKANRLAPEAISSLEVLADASKYQLRNGEVTVYAGMPQITINGDFNMHVENQPISSAANCVVSYKLYIY